MSVPSQDVAVVAAAPGQEPKLSGAALLTASRITRWGLRVAFLIVAARTLGPNEFGVYILLLAVLEIVAIASGTALVDFLTREAAKDPASAWNLGCQAAVLRIVYAVPFGAAGICALWLLGNERGVLEAACVLFVLLLPRAISESAQGVLRGLLRYGMMFAVDLIIGLALASGGILLMVRGGGLGFIVGAEVVAATCGAVLGIILSFRLGRLTGRWTRWSALARRTFAFNVYPLTTHLYDRIDVILLSKLAGEYATGIYGMAYRVLGPLQMIPYGVFYNLLPSLSRGDWGKREKLQLERAMGALMGVAALAVVGTLTLAGPAVQLILGKQYFECVPAMKILIWAVIPMYINYAFTVGLLALGRERVFIATSLVCLAFNATANLVFIPHFSWRAAAVATVATEIVLLAQNCYWMHRSVGTVPVPKFKWGIPA